MLRAIRYLFLALLALALIILALANRDIVTLRLLPADAGQFLGLNWTLRMPLFLVIAAGIILGLLIGFVWEWIREARQRRHGRRAHRKAARLEHELDRLKVKPDDPEDEVLALLEQTPR